MNNKFMIGQIDKIENKVLILGLINIAILSIGHAYNAGPILFVSFIGFILLAIFSPKELFLPIMLFYLPWSPVMKLSPDSFTIYTIILPIFFIYCILGSESKGTFLIRHNIIILTAFIAFLTLVVKLTLRYKIEPDYFVFTMLLLLIPTYLKAYHDKILFKTCIVFMTIGTISACITAEILMDFPHMLPYIDVYIWEQVGLIRTSGFYGDSNFYSTHILISISGLLILAASLYGRAFIFSLIGIVVLIYFGAKSVSKMFLLTLALMLIIWLIAILLLRKNANKKITIIIGIAGVILFILFSDMFTDEINYYIFRFGMANDASTLTTGRSDLWLNYISFLSNNPFMMLFGQGYTQVLPDFNAGSHNTIIQTLYQFGIAGTILIIFWLREFNKEVIIKAKTNKTASQICFVVLFGIACFVPWLALDMLFFDEFFYVTALFFIGQNYIKNQSQDI